MHTYRPMKVPVSKRMSFQDRRDTSAEVVHPFQFQGDDETLIQGMKAEHPGAYRVFYNRHASLVYAVLLRTLGSDDELDILVHEVFFKAFQGIHQLKETGQVKSWLASIAVNTARDTIKHRKRGKWLCFREPSRLPEALDEPRTISDREAVAAVYALLDKLGVDNRIAFSLRYMNEMELTEVADVCNVSLATIKRRLAKAKRQFFALAKEQPALREWIRDE